MNQPANLQVLTVSVDDVRLGPTTGVHNGTLSIDPTAIKDLVLGDSRIESIEVEIARPGDSTRIIHCLDAVEPRTKVGEGVSVFPGFLGGMETVGTGTTLRLSGVSILTSSVYPQPFSGLLQAREAVVDMSGPTSRYSPFSAVVNVVLAAKPNPRIDNEDYDDAIRRASLRVADYLASQAIEESPDHVHEFDFSQRDPDLPDVAYFYQLQGQGSMADSYLYGRPVHNLVPTIMSPNEVIDGAIVSGVYVYGCYKNPTYLHQNNPIIWELQKRHGRELNFVGVIVNRGHNYTQDEKERSSRWATKLAVFLDAEAVILTAEGGGNSAIDMMLACQYMEQVGISTVVVSSEAAGSDGYDFPLFYTVPEANAIVSVGSEDEVVSMPEVDRVLGGEVLLDSETPARGPFDLKMYYQYCGTNQLGANVLQGRVF
ncbi:MAG: glycine/sarcosine/betaine reductase component B subunit [Acidimicrobiia bacterium]